MSELFRQGDRLRAASLNKLGVTQQGWMQYALSFPYAEVGPWMLPGSGDRAGKALGFDGAGAPVMLTLSTNFTDMVTATGSLTARSVQDRFASVRNVRDFGAVGNGTTDDTAAIQAAIARVVSDGGGTVYFPPGSYKHTGLTVTGRCVRLAGDARTHFNVSFGANLFYAGSTTGNWIAVSGSADGFQMQNLHLRRDASVTLAGGAALDMQAVTNAVIENCKITEPWNGVNMEGGAIISIHTLVVGSFTGSYGMRLGALTGSITGIRTWHVTCTAAAFNGDGLLLEGNVASCWFNVHYSNGADRGVRAIAVGATKPGLIYFMQLNCEQCAREGVYLVDYGSFIFDTPWIGSCGAPSIGGQSASGMRFGANGDRQITRVFNGNVGSSGEHGYAVEASLNRISFVNCTALGCSLTTSNTYDGLNIAASAESVQITGGQFGGNNVGNISLPRMRNGIGVGAGATNTSIIGADVRGNVTGGIGDSGTGTLISGVTGWVTEKSGQASIAPDASGNGTIAHGLASTPTFVSVGILGDTVATGVEVQALSGTNITVRIYNESTGADVTSGTFTVMWHARAAQA